MASHNTLRLSASELRRELSWRSRRLAEKHPHELTYGSVPSYVFQDCDGVHGNFHPDSYSAIQADFDWRKRLAKSYAAGQWIPGRWDRARRELDCANSSDALLMNIFCYPDLLNGYDVCALLGIECGLRPNFGFKPKTPIGNGRTDQTEIDMSLGPLLVEAKLTETGFQTAPMRLLLRYPELDEVFDIDDLPLSGSIVQCYQLIRGVLAAKYLDRSFVVFCDSRRIDLIERWFQVMKTVRHCDLRSRLALLTWQELACVLPQSLSVFLAEKYGIVAAG